MILSRRKIERIAAGLGDANFLVFGCGMDTTMWIEKNTNGTSLFLEDLDAWMPSGLDQAVKIEYRLKSTDYRRIYDDHVSRGDNSMLENPIKERLRRTEWHQILVDGPQGWVAKDTHGRMESLYLASQLCGPGTLVFVDDFEREIESLYGGHFFEVLEMVENMAVCRGRGRASQ
jgi:hypothetical protein